PSRMADRLFSRINRRAFSWRSARSSTVMGLASPRSVRRALMAGGRDLSVSADWTSAGRAMLAPAAREPVCRKRRRESMEPPRKRTNYIEWRRRASPGTGETPVTPPSDLALEWLHGKRLCLRRLRGMELDHSG